LDSDPSTGVSYASSIPLSKVFDDSHGGDIIIAYEMNRETLPRDHGYPLRVVIPGVVSARSVKWLKSITLSKYESSCFWQQNDYRVLPMDALPDDMRLCQNKNKIQNKQ